MPRIIRTSLWLWQVGIGRTFAALVLHAQDARDLGADVATLRDIPAPKAETYHQLVEDSRDVECVELAVERRAGGERVAGHRGHDEVVREGRGCVARAHEREDGEKLKEGA